MTELNVTERPVFIVGPLRSGTTLLRLMLENHPKTNFFGEFEGAVSQAKGNAFPDINEYHQFIASDRMMQDSNFTVDEKLNYTELVKYFLQQKHIEKPSDVIGGCIHSRFDLYILLGTLEMSLKVAFLWAGLVMFMVAVNFG